MSLFNPFDNMLFLHIQLIVFDNSGILFGTLSHQIFVNLSKQFKSIILLISTVSSNENFRNDISLQLISILHLSIFLSIKDIITSHNSGNKRFINNYQLNNSIDNYFFHFL